MKKCIWLIPALMLLCSGCALWGSNTPLEAVEAVETMGVDADGGTRVSVATGADQNAEHIDETGETLPLALDKLRDRSEHGGLFYGHTQYLLLGESYARAGVQALLDYAARSAELRLLTPVYVLRGTAADAVLAEDLDVTAQLTALSRTGLPALTALDAADRLARFGCTLVGAVRYDPDAQALYPAGCAVLRHGKLVGYLDADGESAAAWRAGESGEHIALDAGATFSLKSCSVRLAADWSGSTPTALTLSLEAEAEAEQLRAGLAITDADVRARLETQLAQELARRMASAIGQTQAMRADALELGAMLTLAHPIRWRACAGDWERLYPTLPVTVEATARITGTQDLADPLPEEGGA